MTTNLKNMFRALAAVAATAAIGAKAASYTYTGLQDNVLVLTGLPETSQDRADTVIRLLPDFRSEDQADGCI